MYYIYVIFTVLLLVRSLLALDKAVIVEMTEEEFGFFNMVFLRPKKHDPTETRLDKIWRLILDVSPLNKFLVYKHFQMETVEKIRKCVLTEMFATSIDLTDAYHHIPIHPNFHTFFLFKLPTVNSNTLHFRSVSVLHLKSFRKL